MKMARRRTGFAEPVKVEMKERETDDFLQVLY
jgi:hypothetical protein